LESSFLTQPWASVCFGESAFLAKARFGDTGYILLISDLSGIWYESADAEAVGQRSKELNKRLTVPVSSFLHRLRNLMCPLLAGQPDTATSFSCHRTASGLSLHVKSELSGLPFYWYFHCCPAPVEMVSHHLVRPLIRMSLALQYKVQELTSLLLRKDAEIEDYRESGAALSRDRLRTELFQEEMFQQNFMTESLPQICSVGEGQAFASTLQQLYVAVTQQEAKKTRKRQHSETAEHPNPLSLSKEDETASSSEGTTVSTSLETISLYQWQGGACSPFPSSYLNPVPFQDGLWVSAQSLAHPTPCILAGEHVARKPRLPTAKAKPKKAKGLFS
ncbi:Non-homologous end-joining factor 1, partial [Cuculus canorus]